MESTNTNDSVLHQDLQYYYGYYDSWSKLTIHKDKSIIFTVLRPYIARSGFHAIVNRPKKSRMKNTRLLILSRIVKFNNYINSHGISPNFLVGKRMEEKNIIIDWSRGIYILNTFDFKSNLFICTINFVSLGKLLSNIPMILVFNKIRVWNVNIQRFMIIYLYNPNTLYLEVSEYLKFNPILS